MERPARPATAWVEGSASACPGRESADADEKPRPSSVTSRTSRWRAAVVTGGTRDAVVSADNEVVDEPSGATGVPSCVEADPRSVAKSQVENGAVNGDTTRSRRHPAESFRSIGLGNAFNESSDVPLVSKTGASMTAAWKAAPRAVIFKGNREGGQASGRCAG